MAPRVETFGRIRGSSPDRALEECDHIAFKKEKERSKTILF
jgi:hypothetical protein